MATEFSLLNCGWTAPLSNWSRSILTQLNSLCSFIPLFKHLMPTSGMANLVSFHLFVFQFVSADFSKLWCQLLCWVWRCILIRGRWTDARLLPGLRLPPGHVLSAPLGVRGQVIDQLPADLLSGLESIRLLQKPGWEEEGDEELFWEIGGLMVTDSVIQSNLDVYHV